jgi:pyruvate kinase
MIRKVADKVGKYIGIMADTKGPEIRTGVFEDGKVFFNKGDEVTLVKEEVLGNKERFHIACPELFNDIKVGDYLLIDDGKMRLDVVGVSEGEIKAIVRNPGPIKSRKGVNVPNVKLSMPFVSEKDRADLIFSCEMGIDLVAASFVRRREDVEAIREILDTHGGKRVEIIAKIENQEGFNNLEDILKVADGVMVARGDLGVEVNSEYVPVLQKKIIAKANELGKPVITATHMLETMMTNPRPTRAEASDVANAILDGTDAIMLSGESAAGEYPIESVQTMNRIAEVVEEIFPYADRLQKSILSSQATINDAIGIAVSQSALTLNNVAAVIAFTETGGTAKRICKFRPIVPIIAVTDNLDTCRRLTYYWGVTSVIRESVTDIAQYNVIGVEVAKSLGIGPGNKIIIVSGWGQTHGNTNNMRIIEIKE